MSNGCWIWYPGDFELYHAMVQNFSRVERGYGWPAFWKSEGFRNRVVFWKIYTLEEETEFCVFSKATGYVLAGEKKYPFGTRIVCGPGRWKISIHAGRIEEFPSAFVKGDVIYSDRTWYAEDYAGAPVKAGYSRYFTDETREPSQWDYSEQIYEPVHIEPCRDGVLYEFATELTAVLEVQDRCGYRPLVLCCGESREEALDPEHCYYSWIPDPQTGRCPRCAVRYVYIAGCRPEEITLKAIHQYVDIPVRARFSCSDERINKIWQVAEHTFTLCSGIFFVDGIKRDKWIWGGDAYQSFFVNRYLMADADINRRTLLALRGNDPMTTHINTILDYTLYWVLGIKAHFETFGDLEFLESIYPRMCSLMDFCESQLDENGFIVGRQGDWIFIDWADMDKEGALCAEQILFAECYHTLAVVSKVLGIDEEKYQRRYDDLREKIDRFYWNDEKGAYIDSFRSGRNYVSRQSNLFAVLFQIADDEKKALIVENVLHNDGIPRITTPYFKFFEMEALCRMGYLDEVLTQIREYWGGMLKRGAVTFWEEYDPDVPAEEQYDMYGDKFGKSLCHAWSASPIYLLARYFVGLEIVDPVREEYRIRPHLERFEYLECTLPVGRKNIHIVWNGEKLCAGELQDDGEGKSHT